MKWKCPVCGKEYDNFEIKNFVKINGTYIGKWDWGTERGFAEGISKVDL